MKPTTNRKSAAFTMLELIIVLIVIAVLASLLLPRFGRAYQRSNISCLNNLKQIGIAYRVWANDNNGKYPALASNTNEGWADTLTNAHQGALCWTNYVIMANELGQAPRVLICPQDERISATNFSSFRNTNLSYFIGVGASGGNPRSILGGDRNLGFGRIPDPAYGFSPNDGFGNDVLVPTNSNRYPVSWSVKMHSKDQPESCGNILLGDGSVEQISSARFRTNFQPNALDTGNWPSNNIPAVPSFRLIFP